MRIRYIYNCDASLEKEDLVGLQYSKEEERLTKTNTKAKQNQKIKISLWYDNDTTTIYTRLCMNEKNLCHLLLLLLHNNNNNNKHY
mmetsp:Transcript_3600/g.7355  ORF Transcript_3600/g.7355 Transcript_3600/m.7355 type:complete len:86 (-) Transcript_3600:332-589(-)